MDKKLAFKNKQEPVRDNFVLKDMQNFKNLQETVTAFEVKICCFDPLRTKTENTIR